MLKIPKQGEETAPLVASLQRVDFAADGASAMEKRDSGMGRKHGVHVAGRDSGARKSRGRHSMLLLLLVVVVVAAIAGVVVLVLNLPETKPDASQLPPILHQDQFDDLVESRPLLLPEEAPASEEGLPESDEQE